MLRQTDPVRTAYLFPLSAWFDLSDTASAKGAPEVLGIRAFALLRAAVGVAGLAGLDRLYRRAETARAGRAGEDTRWERASREERDALLGTYQLGADLPAA